MSEIAQLNATLADRYEVDREVGAGGMATVYLARDVRHDRRVALKVLKPELGAVLGVERFLAEIKVTANLQHPNLLPLFDSGAADGLLFYVMPFIEGESLRGRLEREKQLPIDDAVRIATSVASALDYAHRQGVIHRDLKPENILLHEGQPLIADFGIALAVSKAGGGRITQTGLSLGTPQYMSPEQATGDRAIDGRTDIYSLGALAYEMLTGEPPHTGSTSQAVIARVLTEKPRSIRATRANVPVQVEAAVDHALEKLPADRFATAREFADALSGKVVVAPTNTTAIRATGHAIGARTGRERALAVALAVVGVLLIATSVTLLRHGAGAVDPQPIRFTIEAPAGPLPLSFSPDGRTIVFVVGSGAKASLWVRPLASADANPLRGTDGVGGFFWSPDSRQIAFYADGKLKRMVLAGGTIETVCNTPGVVNAGSWSETNVIVFSMGGDVYRVSAAGGVPVKIALTAAEAVGWREPWFLPDGKHFVVFSSGATYVASLDGGAPVRIQGGESRAAFAPPNWLLFIRDSTLLAQRFDTRALKLLGDPIRVADDVAENVRNGVAGFGVSTNGALVTRPGSRSLPTAQLQWYSRDGKALTTVGDSGPIHQVNLSADGKRILMSKRGSAAENGVWLVDLATNITSRLVADTSFLGDPIWDRDSRGVTFYSNSGAGSTIHVKPIGGGSDSTIAQRQGRTSLHTDDYSPDGRTLLVHWSDSLFAVHLGGDRTPALLGVIKGVDEVRFSPDGSHVAYGSNESGPWQVYVASYPSLENRRQISAQNGVQPRWRADGKELYYLARDGQVMAVAVMAVAVKAGAAPEFGAPRPLFQSPLRRPNSVLDQFVVSADGQRFLFPVLTAETPDRPPPLSVILNWQSALPRP